MPIVPLGMNAYKRADGFVPEAKMRNMYLEPDKSGISPDQTLRIQRPGLTLAYALAAPIRGMNYRAATGEALTIANGSLYSGTVAKGSIGGSGFAPMVDTTFRHAILGGSTVYLYDGTNVVAVAIPDINGVAQVPVSVDQLNQYILIQCASGAFFWIVPGETTIDPLNFATAESSPDKAVAIRRIGDEFGIFSEDGVEFWQATGDLDAPFQKVTGRSYERGCLDRDSVVRFDNSVMWVDSDCQVCRGGAVPQVVSDNGLSERIRKRTSATSAWTFSYDGHEFYVLNIPGQGTFCFDALTNQWCEFGTYGQTGWEPTVGYGYQGLVRCGGASGSVWNMDGSVGTDNGTVIERTLTATVGFMGKVDRNGSLSVGVGASEDCEVRIRWRDGQEDYPAYYDILDIRAPFDVGNLYRLGLPLEPYREIEFSTISPARIRVAGMMANSAWR